ncbi:MAG: hypothetical protein PUE95_02930 [Lachnospiraceae bacterium]|nr:hypothetical protein [Lachnospiraceae bacterium]
MLNEDLFINGEKINTKDQIDAFYNEARFSCTINDYALEVEFSIDGAAFIGWLNCEEEIFYYDNGSGNKDSVNLLINVCPEERMMCYDLNILKDIVAYFCETGLRNPKYNWIEEGF